VFCTHAGHGFSTLACEFPLTLNGVVTINQHLQSGDGGLYAEMLQNRAFQQVTPSKLHFHGSSDIVFDTIILRTDTGAALSSWSPVNGARIAIVENTTPLSDALPNSMQLTVPTGSTGSVGVQNSGFSGMSNQSTAREDL